MIKMSTFQAIQALAEDGVPKKGIARRLGVDVRTVRKHLARIEEGEREPSRRSVASKLDRFRPMIESRVEQGFSATQIFQELSALADFEASYQTVRRLVRKLRPVSAEVYGRLRFEPAEEAQVDFGEVGYVEIDGRRRKLQLFVVTLCYSRHAYYELVLDQTVPTFLSALRRAFEFFGGVPKRIKPDNLKSAVLLDALGRRYYQEDFFRFCRHYGAVPDAARPRTPTDKGRCERDIGYAKSNFFRARRFGSFEEAQQALRSWRDEIANLRVHGTTRRRPVDLFAEEKAELLALPEEAFEVARWGAYLARKDCHVQVEGNYYSVPFRLVGSKVFVRLSDDTVTVFAEGEVVARHGRPHTKGATITDESHYPPFKRSSTQEIHQKRCMSVRSAGPHAREFLHRLRESGWVFGPQLRQLAGLVSDFGADSVDQACRRALFYQATDGAQVIERILERDLHVLPLDTGSWTSGDAEGDYGRNLEEYDRLLAGKEAAS